MVITRGPRRRNHGAKGERVRAVAAIGDELRFVRGVVAYEGATLAAQLEDCRASLVGLTAVAAGVTIRGEMLVMMVMMMVVGR